MAEQNGKIYVHVPWMQPSFVCNCSKWEKPTNVVVGD